MPEDAGRAGLAGDAAPRWSALPTGPADPISSAQLAQRFAGGHGGRQRHVEAAAAALHRDQKAGVGQIVDAIGHAGRFAPNRRMSPSS